MVRPRPTSVYGSSPLTRGKPLILPQNHAVFGLIPAHAGKTTSSSCMPDTSTAHPRSRGENTDLSERDTGHIGSSPLTRGKRTACTLESA